LIPKLTVNSAGKFWSATVGVARAAGGWKAFKSITLRGEVIREMILQRISLLYAKYATKGFTDEFEQLNRPSWISYAVKPD
jgi:hypothetical protein